MSIFGIGTDITSCERIQKMIEKHGEYFVSRVYSDWETLYCRGRRESVESFTGRWCAKEAILKAIGTGWIRGIAWRDMEVRTRSSGAPYVLLGGGVLDFVNQHGISEILVSISHCRTYATAMAVAVCEENPFPIERTFVRIEEKEA
ncbi:MAG: holo-ACP synthase [Planctomycetia bacterium]|nr:holo-ACP synthase [Planctomycetia bacterium]